MCERGGCKPAQASGYDSANLFGNITTRPRAPGKAGSPVEITSVIESVRHRPDAQPAPLIGSEKR